MELQNFLYKIRSRRNYIIISYQLRIGRDAHKKSILVLPILKGGN